METRHTPGPWVAALEGNLRPLIIQDLTGRPIPIASIIHQGGGDFDPSETTQVNAHLIAAAPELLAALRRAVPWLGKLIADGGHLQSVCPNDAIGALQQAEAALARAKGE